MKVGDVVRCIKVLPEDGMGPVGYIGTIVVIDPDKDLGVDFSGWDGHNLGQRLRTDTGWWCKPWMLKLAPMLHQCLFTLEEIHGD